jgi:hypothetical protein
MNDIEKAKQSIVGRDRQKLLDKAYEVGFQYERDYHGCAQAMVGALQEVLGIVKHWLMRVDTVMSAPMWWGQRQR